MAIVFILDGLEIILKDPTVKEATSFVILAKSVLIGNRRTEE